MRVLSYLFLLLLILIGITFATLNPDIVTVNYYIGQQQLPLSLLLVSVFGLGGILGILVGFWFVINTKIKNYRLRQRLKMAEKEIENLRAIPLQNKH